MFAFRNVFYMTCKGLPSYAFRSVMPKHQDHLNQFEGISREAGGGRGEGCSAAGDIPVPEGRGGRGEGWGGEGPFQQWVSAPGCILRHAVLLPV